MDTINRPQSSDLSTRRAVGAAAITAGIITLIGGLNWGLVGIADFDLVAALFGTGSVVSRIVYIIVALASIWTLASLLGMSSRAPTTH